MEPMTFDEIAEELRGLCELPMAIGIERELYALADAIDERMELTNQRLYEVLLQKALKKPERTPNSSVIRWHDAAKEPEEFVPVLLWCPNEKPCPEVVEGYYTEERGYMNIRYHDKCTPVMWADMPMPPKEESDA